ncbi:hypothetical protein MiSe_94560 [Microseira wollei NIES-4236]|uniref:Transposase n=1 Tax=Microseira wollei NIES-4236 TaxID=2530354 RepID=A0AAV3XT01_9CYAN|nr:hypothetical protein MiSe_94560 [Microseira wollei NIES-4236]
MEPANQKKLQKHLQAIAKIMYQEAETKELESLAGIEKTIRSQTLEYITLFYQRSNRKEVRVRKIKIILGELPVSEKQARKLKLDKNQKISPYLEQCCLRTSANVSYENAAKDIYKYTGMSISASTQQRIVQRYEFPEIEGEQEIEEISLNGGKVRLRTEPCMRTMQERL